MSLIPLINKYLDFVKPLIKSRGVEIYLQDAFDEVTVFEDNDSFTAKVLSSTGVGSYEVGWSYDPEIDEVFPSCTCPYFESDGSECKHVVAAAFKWKKLLPQKNTDLIKPDKINIKKDGRAVYAFHLPSLEQWFLQRYASVHRYDYGFNYREPIVENREAKSCSLSFGNGIIAVAAYHKKDVVNLSCRCGELKDNRFCEHVYTLLCEIRYKYGFYYFSVYNDYTSQVNQVLERYGLQKTDELAKDFKFGLDDRGEFSILKKPANLLPIAAYTDWEHVLSAVIIPKMPPLALSDKKLPSNIVTAGLIILLGGKYGLPLWIDGLVVTEKKGQPGYKKIALQNDEDLLAYIHMPATILKTLSRLTNESLLDMVSLKTADPYFKNFSSPWQRIDDRGIAGMTLTYREVLTELIEQQADLPFFILRPELAFGNANCQPVSLNAEEVTLQFKVSFKNGFWNFSALVREEERLTPLCDYESFPPFFLKRGQTLTLLKAIDEGIIQLFQQGDFMVNHKDTPAFIEKILKPIGLKYPIDFDETVKVETLEAKGLPVLYLSELNDSFIMIRPVWRYGEQEVAMNGETELMFNEGFKLVRVLRNKADEEEFIAAIQEFHPKFKLQRGNEYFYLPFAAALEDSWFLNFFAGIQKMGISVYGLSELKQFRYNSNKPSVKTTISSGTDWFDLSIEIHYGDLSVSLAALKKAVLAKQQYILLSDGTLGMLPEDWIRKYSSMFNMGQVKDENLKLAKWHYTLLDELYDQIDNEAVLSELAHKRNQLQQIDHFKAVSLPVTLKANLRDYQMAGFQWINQLDEIGWGGCLADDMGLGKTLQALAFLQHRIDQQPSEVHLIVCPTSLLYNWETEIQKFTPHLRYLIHYGTERSFDNHNATSANLIITSYGTVRADIRYFSNIDFGYVLLDESQYVKNPAAQITKAVSLLKAKNRLILSGTPFQNNTFDIYAQMNFLNPGMLGSIDFFKREFAVPIDKANDKEKSDILRKMISPFLLRRTKEQVAKDLPDKTETILWCEMEKEQRKIYDEVKNYYREQLLDRIDTDGMGKSSIYILDGLLKLRQICDSTALLKDGRPNYSVKITELLRELTENTGTHKVLVFSQFVEMLHLIKIELDKLQISYAYLDGSTPSHKRIEAVNQFQNDGNERVFLISLKAGGVGLNLTSADYVYLVDPWWNPAVEQQAIDRTHRIGQTNKVFAYKMICKDTVEEKILQLQEKKKALASDLIAEETGFVKKLTKEDVAFLFS